MVCGASAPLLRCTPLPALSGPSSRPPSNRASPADSKNKRGIIPVRKNRAEKPTQCWPIFCPFRFQRTKAIRQRDAREAIPVSQGAAFGTLRLLRFCSTTMVQIDSTDFSALAVPRVLKTDPIQRQQPPNKQRVADRGSGVKSAPLLRRCDAREGVHLHA
jgi:hypothetical protein